jgi:protease-4
VGRVAEAREMTVADVEEVARGRVWTGADASERGLVDELGGLRTAVRRAKSLAGLDVDAKVQLVGYPGSSVLDFLRPRASSQPAAASLSDAAVALVSGVVGDVVARGRRDLTGVTALWLGDWQF